MWASFALFLAASGGDAALVLRGVSDDSRSTHEQQCVATFACASSERMREAIDDAQSLGISCDTADDLCWRRFLAAEEFDRVVVVTDRDGAVQLRVIEHKGEPRGANGASADAAWRALRGEVASTPSPHPPTAVGDAEIARPADHAGQAEVASGGGVALPFVVAGAGAAVALGSGLAAAVISASLAQSLEDAESRRAPLENHAERNAAFFACAALSGVGAVVALGALGVGVLSD